MYERIKQNFHCVKTGKKCEVICESIKLLQPNAVNGYFIYCKGDYELSQSFSLESECLERLNQIKLEFYKKGFFSTGVVDQRCDNTTLPNYWPLVACKVVKGELSFVDYIETGLYQKAIDGELIHIGFSRDAELADIKPIDISKKNFASLCHLETLFSRFFVSRNFNAIEVEVVLNHDGITINDLLLLNRDLREESNSYRLDLLEKYGSWLKSLDGSLCVNHLINSPNGEGIVIKPIDGAYTPNQVRHIPDAEECFVSLVNDSSVYLVGTEQGMFSVPKAPLELEKGEKTLYQRTTKTLWKAC